MNRWVNSFYHAFPPREFLFYSWGSIVQKTVINRYLFPHLLADARWVIQPKLFEVADVETKSLLTSTTLLLCSSGKLSCPFGVPCSNPPAGRLRDRRFCCPPSDSAIRWPESSANLKISLLGWLFLIMCTSPVSIRSSTAAMPRRFISCAGNVCRLNATCYNSAHVARRF